MPHKDDYVFAGCFVVHLRLVCGASLRPSSGLVPLPFLCARLNFFVESPCVPENVTQRETLGLQVVLFYSLVHHMALDCDDLLTCDKPLTCIASS